VTHLLNDRTTPFSQRWVNSGRVAARGQHGPPDRLEPRMTRHAAYALTSRGYPRRHPFASFPTDAAIRWLAAHPDTPVRFVPALPAFSGLTGHWTDCATYDTLDASDCTCYARPVL
jgi:hypothetical protein